MASEQSSTLLYSPVVKEEPTEEQPEIEAPFCCETVPKEEIILEDERVSEQSSDQLPVLLPPVVKEEPPEEQPVINEPVKEEPPEEQPDVEAKSFCYETVTKEEVILEDEEAAAVWDEPESDNGNSNQADGKITTGGTIKCAECDRTFNKQFKLNRHIKWHNAIKLGLNRCTYCNKTFGYKGSLNRHIESHKQMLESTGASSLNPDEPALELKLPLLVRRGKRSTKVSADQEVTVEIILDEGVEVIDEPEHDNETPSEPVEPIAELTEDGDIQCTECGRTFQKFTGLKKHFRWHKAIELGLYRCNYCNKEFSSKANLLRHTKSHERILEESKTGGSSLRRGKRKRNTPPITCPECGKVFEKQGIFNNHFARHEAKKLGLYTCDLCNMRLPTKISLHLHKLVHQKGEDRFTCRSCHERFTSRSDLSKHLLVHKTDSLFIKFAQQVIQNEDGTFRCTICGKVFSNRKNALGHFRRHVQPATGDSSSTVDPPEPDLYICDLCGKRWKRKSQIRRHMEVHKGDRYRPCLICQMKFKTTAALISHSVVHKTDERSVRFREVVIQDDRGAFTCTACGKHFKTRNQARAHFRNNHPV